MIAVLGGGISGLTAATLLSEAGYEVSLFEQSNFIGGLASTAKCFDVAVDIGSHRIHPTYHPDAMKLVRELLSDDLVCQKRNGRILILGKYIDYPPNLLTLLRGFGLAKCIEWGLSFSREFLTRNKGEKKQNFENFTISRVGKSLYEDFYKPYAWKLWNLDPTEIAIDPAKQRVRRMEISGLLKKFFKKLFSTNESYYYYPKHGIGQIAEELQVRFLKAGGKVYLNSEIVNIDVVKNRIETVVLKRADEEEKIHPDKVISSLPLRIITRIIKDEDCVQKESGRLEYRSLKIIHLKVLEKSDSIFETFYIPSQEYKIGRISEVSKYSQTSFPNRVLTAEIPCSYNDDIWTASKEKLLSICKDELVKLEIIANPDSIIDLEFVNVPNIYPIYRTGWKEKYSTVIDEVNSVENLYHFGRTALFLHCNIDHCIHMSQATVDLIQRSHSRSEWKEMQNTFLDFYVRE